jgi:hypothetical protein
MEEYEALTRKKHFIGIDVLPLSGNMTKDIYAMTVKLDGERVLLFVDSNKNIWSISRRYVFNKLTRTTKLPGLCIFDCELFNNRFHIFDVLYYAGKDVMKEKLLDRLNHIKEFKSIKSITRNKYFFGNGEQLYKQALKSLPLVKNDGLIFTPIDREYTKKYPPLKWKEANTIDLRIRKRGGYWELFTKDKRLFMCQHKISAPPPDIDMLYPSGSVVEFDMFEGALVPIRLRSDKKDGNYYDVAVSNYKLLKHKTPLEMVKLVNNTI